MFLFAPIRWALKLLYFLVLAVAVYLVVSGFQVVFASRLAVAAGSPRPATAIVVLGAPVVAGAPGPDLTARLDQALALYHANKAPTVVVTGAPSLTGGVAVVTSVERKWLVASGVPGASIQSLDVTSAASALSQVSALLGRGTTVIVVTDALDALWAKGAASNAGLAAQISPAVGSERPLFDEPGLLWREASGVAVGRLVGYDRATWAAG